MLLLLLACSTPAPEAAPQAAAPAPAAPAPVAEATPAKGGAANPTCTPTTFGSLPGEGVEAVEADALRTGAVESGSNVVVSGTIKKVCQAKGCWHTIATSDPAVDLMVKDKEYGIFLPGGCEGHPALVAGTFTREVVPLEEAKHYAKDAGENPDLITEAPTRLLIEVQGVQVM